MYHFEEDDKKLAEDYDKCVKGELMCGDHKKECVDKVLTFIKNHRKKKEQLFDKARKVLKIE